MRDPSLKFLVTSVGCFVSVRDDVDESDSIQSDHFLEIDVTVLVSVNVITRDTEVSAVRV